MSNLLYVFVLGLSLGASFLFSGMEAGVMAINRLRVRQLARKGHAKARVLEHLFEQPERFLWTILVGNTLANFIVVTIAAHYLYHEFGEWGWRFWLAFLALAALLYAGCDLLPKMLFRTFSTRLCLSAASAFQLSNTLLAPLVSIVQWLSDVMIRLRGGKALQSGTLFGNRDEMRLVMQEAAQVLSEEERLMINRVLDFQNLPVRQIAIPWDQTVSVDARTPLGEVLPLCREKNLSRLPVWQGEGAQRRIAGLLSLRLTLYREDFHPSHPAGQYLKPALYLAEDMPLELALARLQSSGERLAIVLDRDQRPIGIVTLEDMLGVIFGEVTL